MSMQDMAGDRVDRPGAGLVQLVQMKQQEQVRTAEDDWTGVTAAKQRRKLQNRLNQRLYRQRRRAPPKPDGASIDVSLQLAKCSGKFIGLVEALSRDYEACNTLLELVQSTENPADRKWLTGHGDNKISNSRLEGVIAQFEQMIDREYLSGSPRVDLLLTLVQFNVFRALLANTNSMGFTREWLECSEPESPWTSLPRDAPPSVPLSLRPTPLQRAIKHHPWLDLWPIPRMRDNMLLALDSYDEDQLCNDMVEFHGLPNEQTGLIVWSEPWNEMGWEVSETFLKNWGWTVKGCVELMTATNLWRSRRGEYPLVFELD